MEGGDASPTEATATTADDKQAASTERKKLSKNAVKRIKWVKRHRKKTVSKRKRKANLKLARARPQRDVQDRVAKAVEYLNAWYESPETWKYQKIAQISLIKHAFNSQLVGSIAIICQYFISITYDLKFIASNWQFQLTCFRSMMTPSSCYFTILLEFRDLHAIEYGQCVSKLSITLVLNQNFRHYLWRYPNQKVHFTTFKLHPTYKQ